MLGFGTWLLIGPVDGPVLAASGIGLEVDEGVTGLRSGSPSSFWICSSSISPCFRELELFLLELGSPESRPDRSRSGSTVWGDGLRAGTEEGDGIPRRNNQHTNSLNQTSWSTTFHIRMLSTINQWDIQCLLGKNGIYWIDNIMGNGLHVVLFLPPQPYAVRLSSLTIHSLRTAVDAWWPSCLLLHSWALESLISA